MFVWKKMGGEKRKGKERKEEKMREKKGQFQSNLLNLTRNYVIILLFIFCFFFILLQFLQTKHVIIY